MNFPGYPPAISHIRKFKILIKNGQIHIAHGKINGKIIITMENTSSKMDKSTLQMGKLMGKSSSQWKILIKNGQIHIANGKSSSIVSAGRCFMLPGLSSQRAFSWTIDRPLRDHHPLPPCLSAPDTSGRHGLLTAGF